MHEIFRELNDCLQDRRTTAYCRLVETRGSTPQKAGAVMLVFPDGSQAGTLGGGCVEAEVKRRALSVLQDRKAQVAVFQLDNDYGWDDGLICGGRMQILIEPLQEDISAAATPHREAYFQTLGELNQRGKGLTEAIVFDAKASGLTAPSSYLFDEHGDLAAALHGELDSCPDHLKETVLPLDLRPRPYAKSGVAYLPLLPRCPLVIVGGGHVGKAVADLAVDLEFDVCIIDDRKEFVALERFPRAQRRISGPVDEVLPDLEITSDTYCLIVTRGHNHDEEALYHLADRGARYVGLIGSRRKIKMIFEDLLAEGVSAESLERVYAPLGVDIGSQSVPEIAVSICAELVAHRNLGGKVPGRPDRVVVQKENEKSEIRISKS